MTNPALKNLGFLLKESPALTAECRNALFIRACADADFKELALPGLICHQTFKPEVDALEALEFKTTLEPKGPFDLVLYLGTGQRDENLFNFARAASWLGGTGRLICSMHNDLGAGRFEKKMRELFGQTGSFSKNHCRVFWNTAPMAGKSDLAAQWLELGAIKTIEGTDLVSRPGQFGWNKLDRGSELLCRFLPPALNGEGADLGAGFGHISSHLLKKVNEIGSLHIYEAEHLALEVCRMNLEKLPRAAAITYNWHDVGLGLLHSNLDWIVMNPPFHRGRAARPELGRRFIEAASDALKPGGVLYMVANNHLPYRETLRAWFGRLETVTEEAGFIVFRAHK